MGPGFGRGPSPFSGGGGRPRSGGHNGTVIANPFGRERRARAALLRSLIRGDEVEVSCQLRRTSARGWGPWTEARVVAGSLVDGNATWHVDDPIAVGAPSVSGPVATRFTGFDEVWLRPVRFRTEAFWGMDAEIIVLKGERKTIELACDPTFSDHLADRLRDLLDLP